MFNKHKPNAFTLVELMAALVIVSILVAMASSAWTAAVGTANKSRCERQVQAIHELIATRLEEFITRRVSTPERTAIAEAAFPDYSILAGNEANRARLIEIRHLLKSELPDRISDLIPPPAGHPWWTPPLRFRTSAGAEQTLPITRFGGSLPTGVSKYVALVNSLTNGNFAGWSTKYEGSETLYLILATSQVGGRNGLQLIPENQIADLDGDGVPEVLDPWGTPMVWIRWPVGYWLTYANRDVWGTATETDRYLSMQNAMDRLGDDQFDILQSDWRNLDTTPRPTGGNWNRTFGTFNILPLVVAAGPDRNFDMMLRSSQATPTEPGPEWLYGAPLNYTMLTWPEGAGGNSLIDVPNYGRVRRTDPGYGTPYFYIDPYLAIPGNGANAVINVDYATETFPFTQNFTAGLPGAYYDANADSYDDSSDNIFSLGARP